MSDPTTAILSARHAAFVAMLKGDEGARRTFRELNRQYVVSKRPQCQVKPPTGRNPARKRQEKPSQSPIQPTLF